MVIKKKTTMSNYNVTDLSDPRYWRQRLARKDPEPVQTHWTAEEEAILRIDNPFVDWLVKDTARMAEATKSTRGKDVVGESDPTITHFNDAAPRGWQSLVDRILYCIRSQELTSDDAERIVAEVDKQARKSGDSRFFRGEHCQPSPDDLRIQRLRDDWFTMNIAKEAKAKEDTQKPEPEIVKPWQPSDSERPYDLRVNFRTLSIRGDEFNASANDYLKWLETLDYCMAVAREFTDSQKPWAPSVFVSWTPTYLTYDNGARVEWRSKCSAFPGLFRFQLLESCDKFILSVGQDRLNLVFGVNG